MPQPGSTDSSVPVYVALDFPSLAETRRWLTPLPQIRHVKVGLELYLSQSESQRDFWAYLHDTGRQVFLDLKLHDIPNTVAGAVRSLGRAFEDFPGLLQLTTLHAAGGAEMLGAARAARDDAFGPGGPALLGVTVLTSLSDTDTTHWPGGAGRGPWVSALAEICRENGVDGVVTSVHEAPLVRRLWPQALVVTPGIRWDKNTADQKAVGGVAQAIGAGATHLVVGRPITQAEDPAAAYDTCLKLIQAAE